MLPEMACFSQYILGDKLRYGYLHLVQLIPVFVVGHIPTGKLEGARICHGQHSDSANTPSEIHDITLQTKQVSSTVQQQDPTIH